MQALGNKEIWVTSLEFKIKLLFHISNIRDLDKHNKSIIDLQLYPFLN